MFTALKTMSKTIHSDPRAFAVAYGQFGEGMARNMFTFGAAVKLAGEGVGVEYLIEGTLLSMYYRSWTIDSSGRWIANLVKPNYKGLQFNPATRHSRVRGLMIGEKEVGKMPNFKMVEF